MKLPKKNLGEPFKVTDLDDINITVGEGFLAMGKFVAAFGRRVPPESALATLWADIEVEKDGIPGDPAALDDWVDAVQAVLDERKHD